MDAGNSLNLICFIIFSGPFPPMHSI